MLRAIALLSVLLAVTGCGSLAAQSNAPQTVRDESRGYRLANLSSASADDDMILVVSFSGGGKRSAAFGYGALTAMRDMKMPGTHGSRSLLHEIDLLTGVSGGSFPAAYYALHRDGIFTDFRGDFLDEDFNADIAGIYLLPWNWRWVVNPQWGTNDEMARIYDQRMFHGATYADLEKLGPPIAMVQATDLGNGAPFAFIQSQFDLLCSDMSSYPLARAVAASNGFPVLFTPITLRNYSRECPVAPPAWVAPALRDPDPLSRQRQMALLAQRYLTERGDDYVHLIDGGVGDNLAMRGLLDYMARYENPSAAPDPDGRLKRLRRVVFISIDGQAAQDRTINRTPIVGGVFRVLDAVTSNTIDRYNFETLRLARTAAKNLAANLTKLRCASGADGARAALIHIALSEQPGAEVLKDIPTGLTIAPDQVDALIAAGRAAVLRDPALKQVIATIDEKAPCPAATAAN